MRFGFKFQLGAVWLGVHYSPYNKRFCINFIPCLTVWVCLPGGKTPEELLLTRELKPEKQKDLLGRYRQSETMSGIINELLDLARIESRQGKDFTLGAEDLSDLVHEVIQDFKTPEGRDAPIVDVAVGETMVWVDRKKMQQAVLNVKESSV